jgi:hypothetical protein
MSATGGGAGAEDPRDPYIDVPICPNGHGNIYPELSYCKVCHHGRQRGEEFDLARYVLADGPDWQALAGDLAETLLLAAHSQATEAVVVMGAKQALARYHEAIAQHGGEGS